MHQIFLVTGNWESEALSFIVDFGMTDTLVLYQSPVRSRAIHCPSLQTCANNYEIYYKT